jgi:hypothetical protein
VRVNGAGVFSTAAVVKGLFYFNITKVYIAPRAIGCLDRSADLMFLNRNKKGKSVLPINVGKLFLTAI